MLKASLSNGGQGKLVFEAVTVLESERDGVSNLRNERDIPHPPIFMVHLQ